MLPLFVQLRIKFPAALLAAMLCCCSTPVLSDAPAADSAKSGTLRNDYPTSARVEYVQECVVKNGGEFANLYKCSCAIDRMAEHFTYDDFVEAQTFAHYSTLGGEGGGIFRDPDHAKERARLFRSVEADAYRACGLKTATP